MRSMLSGYRGSGLMASDESWDGLDAEAEFPLLNRQPSWMLVSILLVYGTLLFTAGLVLVN